MGMLGAVLNLDQIGTPARFISIGVPFLQGDDGRWIPEATQALTYFQEYMLTACRPRSLRQYSLH